MNVESVLPLLYQALGLRQSLYEFLCGGDAHQRGFINGILYGSLCQSPYNTGCQIQLCINSSISPLIKILLPSETFESTHHHSVNMSSPESSASQTPMRAMKKVLEAFARWGKEGGRADALHLDMTKLTNALGIEFQVEVTRPIPCPVPIAFLKSLPSVDLAELTEDSRDCGICAQPMAPLGSLTGDVVKDLNDEVNEEAKRLPCSHVIGLKCLAHWFNPLERSNNNTCPYCRAVCFPKFPTKTTLKGAQARLDAFDWHLQLRGTGPTPKEAVQIQNLTSIILQDRLAEAFLELEASRAEVDKEVAEQTGVVNATYRGPRRAPCSTVNLALFFIKQQFLEALMLLLSLVQIGAYFGEEDEEDDDEFPLEYIFSPEPVN